MPMQKWPPWPRHLEDTITEALAGKLMLAGGMDEYRKLARDVAEAVHREGYRLETEDEAKPEVQADGAAGDQGTERGAQGSAQGGAVYAQNGQTYPRQAQRDDRFDY